MKFSIYSSVDDELDAALKEFEPQIPASNSPSENFITDPSIISLEEWSYVLKFTPGNYFSHLKPDPEVLKRYKNLRNANTK